LNFPVLIKITILEQKMMNWEAYLETFDTILNSENPPSPYNDAEYLNYTKLNSKRLHRWLKTAVLLDETKAAIQAINQPQHWIVITEPWCGDAAHILPILYLMAALNEKITFAIQLRDADSEIDQYLTNGGKAIPILIVRDETEKDLFHWGPRPVGLQTIFMSLKERNAPLDEIIEILQLFYNQDKAVSIQKEIVNLLADVSV
jgi:hypothetical protein